jgi:hypothetical protein
MLVISDYFDYLDTFIPIGNDYNNYTIAAPITLCIRMKILSIRS